MERDVDMGSPDECEFFEMDLGDGVSPGGGTQFFTGVILQGSAQVVKENLGIFFGGVLERVVCRKQGDY